MKVKEERSRRSCTTRSGIGAMNRNGYDMARDQYQMTYSVEQGILEKP